MQVAPEEWQVAPAEPNVRPRCRALSHREQRPLLMIVGENGDAESSFANVLPLESLLASKYTLAMEKGRHRDFNVHLIKGSFLQMNTMGFKVMGRHHLRAFLLARAQRESAPPTPFRQHVPRGPSGGAAT
eukprot:3536420-Prymnesium_polylepis.2